MRMLLSPMVGLLVLVATSAGCRTTATPSFAHPGGAEAQRKQAVRYDPYPDPNIGPSVDGARPRDYQQPMAEPASARWHLDPKNNNERWLNAKCTATQL
jgi:hypothetical protein